MNLLTRSSAFAALLAAGTVMLASCSGGVSVPAAGSGPTATPVVATSTPAGGPVTATPVSVTTTSPAATPTPGSGVTATPTAIATTVGSSPTPSPTPTSMSTTMSGCPPTFPSPQPVSSSTAFPNGGGTVNIPNFGDQVGTVLLPTSNATGSRTLTFQTSQNTFVDNGGGTSIPTPQPGYTALSYTASGISGGTFTFGGDQDIVVSAKAPCEITAPFTTGEYVAYVYANGGGFNHSELSPVAGYDANETSAMDGTISFTISLASTQGLNPQGVNLETVFAKKN